MAEADQQYQFIYRKFFYSRNPPSTTTCGTDCIKKLWQMRFDLLIVDLDIPCGDGRIVLKVIDQMPADSRPAVLVVAKVYTNLSMKRGCSGNCAS